MRVFLMPVTTAMLLMVLASCTGTHYTAIQGTNPFAITVNIKDMSLSFVDLEEQKNTQHWKMEKPYQGGVLLEDSDTLLLYGKQVETVDLFSIKQGKQIDSWETGKGLVNAMLLSNNEIVFADQHQHAVRFFTKDGVETGKTKTAKNPLTLIKGQQSEDLYVLSFNDEQLTMIDIRNKTKEREYPIHSYAAGALLIDETNELWIGGHGAGQKIETDIHIYDSITGKLKKSVPVPVMPVNFVKFENYIYVLSHGSSTLYKLDEKGQKVDFIKIGANPFEMQITENQLIIAGYDSNDIHIINLDTFSIIKTATVGKGPFQMIIRERQTSE